MPVTSEFNAFTSLADEDLSLLRSLGCNVLRVGVMWPGVEPSRGQYNLTYLQALADLTSRASAYGIYSVLDMHQDDLSELFCGEGIPLWAADRALAAARESGQWVLPFPSPVELLPWDASHFETSTGYALPTKQACARHDWPSYQLAQATGVGYQMLYTLPELTLAWADMWRTVASFFRGHTEVLGYEIINEPFAGNPYQHPSRVLPGVSDRELLQPAYDSVSSAIRSVHPDALVLFAGVTWDDLGTGFTHPPGGAQFANFSVSAFHYYEPPQFKDSEQAYYGVRCADAARLQTGAFVTEMASPDKGNNYDAVADAADAHGLSYMMWEYKDFCLENDQSRTWPSQNSAYGSCKTGFGGGVWDAQGQLVAEQARRMARAYPQAVAGELQSFSFNVSSSALHLSFRLDAKAQLPTEVFVSETYHYPLGLQVLASPSGHVAWTRDATRHLLLLTPTALAVDGEIISVSVTPASAPATDTLTASQ